MKKDKEKYDKEFKVNTAKLYLESGRSLNQLGQELGVPPSTIAGWVEKYHQDKRKHEWDMELL